MEETDQSGNIKQDGSKTHGKVHKYYIVSGNTAKEALNSRLKLQTPGEYYIHFSNRLEPEYYEQLTSEAPKWKMIKGRMKKMWMLKSGVHNEALDCWVYAFAALYAHNNEYQSESAKMIEVSNEIAKQPIKSNYLQSHKYRD